MIEDFKFWASEQAWALLPGVVVGCVWLLVAAGIGFVLSYGLAFRNGKDYSPGAFMRWWGILGGGLFALGVAGFHLLRLVGATFTMFTGAPS